MWADFFLSTIQTFGKLAGSLRHVFGILEPDLVPHGVE